MASSVPRKPPLAAIARNGLKALGRPIVVGVAVGEREAANALRVQCSEDLCDTAAAVVANEIYLIDVQSIEKFPKHLRIGIYRYVLIRRDFCVAVRKQVDGYAAPDVGQIHKLMAPQIPVKEHSVHEQGDRSCALFCVGNTTRCGLYTTLHS
jgi:hypothetical protein